LTIQSSVPKDMHEALRIVEPGQVEVETLISRVLPLEELQEGFEVVANQQGRKLMAEISGAAV
jgi:threonine dehydrogenase-like Zn-dependent dehydrogenase